MALFPIPGIDAAVLAKLLEQQRGTIIEMFNMFSGGALSRASIFALGIMRYISASIIIQLLTVVHPTLAEIKKKGSLVVVRLASTPVTVLWCWQYSSRLVLLPVCRICLVRKALINPGFAFYFTAVVSLVRGTMFLTWLGEQITNQVSATVFQSLSSPVSSRDSRQPLPYTIQQARQGDLHFLVLLLVAVLVFAVTFFFVVFVERGQCCIVVNLRETSARSSCLMLHRAHIYR
ncbi:hypothetical protein ACLK1T_15280 [Escherichia coli]